MAGPVALASHRVHAANQTKRPGGPRSLGRRPGSPHVSRHCPRRQLESEYARRKVESSLGAGGWIAASCGPGTGCSPANVPTESLDDWLVPACYFKSFTAPVLTHDYRERPPKISGCLRIEGNTNHTRASRKIWSSRNFPADRAGVG